MLSIVLLSLQFNPQKYTCALKMSGLTINNIPLDHEVSTIFTRRLQIWSSFKSFQKDQYFFSTFGNSTQLSLQEPKKVIFSIYKLNSFSCFVHNKMAMIFSNNKVDLSDWPVPTTLLLFFLRIVSCPLFYLLPLWFRRNPKSLRWTCLSDETNCLMTLIAKTFSSSTIISLKD